MPKLKLTDFNSMADIMRVSEDYDDSEYDISLYLARFQYGNNVFQTTTNQRRKYSWKSSVCTLTMAHEIWLW